MSPAVALSVGACFSLILTHYYNDPPPFAPLLLSEEDRDRLKSVLATQDEILNVKISSECAAVRDDTNHKLALQVAENKRMQALLAKATDDCNRLSRLCENLSVRVQILEAHT